MIKTKKKKSYNNSICDDNFLNHKLTCPAWIRPIIAQAVCTKFDWFPSRGMYSYITQHWKFVNLLLIKESTHHLESQEIQRKTFPWLIDLQKLHWTKNLTEIIIDAREDVEYEKRKNQEAYN